MIELSKSLYNAMAIIQCQSSYSEVNKCLCPDKISYSLFEYSYYTKFDKNEREVKEIKLENGYLKVIFEDEYDICSDGRDISSDMELIDFRTSEIQRELDKFAKQQLTEQVFLINGLAVLRTLNIKYQSDRILYEDIKDIFTPDFLEYKISNIVINILEKVYRNENCEEEILTLIKLGDKKFKLQSEMEEFYNQFNNYRISLYRELKKRHIKVPDISSFYVPKREDPIDLPNKHVEEMLSMLQWILEKYCNGKEVTLKTLLKFKTRYKLNVSANMLDGEKRKKRKKKKDIDYVYRKVLIYHNKMAISLGHAFKTVKYSLTE